MRRLAFLLATLVALAGCAEESLSTDSTTTSSLASTTTTRSVGDAPAAGEGVVVEVVDGDTIRVELGGEIERVRLIGINAPERDECLGDEAGRFLRDRIDSEQVELVRDVSDRDQYGRLLRYVELDGDDVGEELVRVGLAIARDYRPDTARSDRYRRAQDDAEAAGVGMWTPDACGPGTEGVDVFISEIRFDADGDDNLNLNDEWVRITNRGDSPVDLTGWVLKDTSATHRYPFPDGFTLAPAATITVRSGCGTDSATDLHWCSQRSAVWNNSGDTAYLLDPAGNIVHSVSG